MANPTRVTVEPDDLSFVVWFDVNGDPRAVHYRNDGFEDDYGPGRRWSTASQTDEDEDVMQTWRELRDQQDGFDGPYLLTLAVSA